MHDGRTGSKHALSRRRKASGDISVGREMEDSFQGARRTRLAQEDHLTKISEV